MKTMKLQIQTLLSLVVIGVTAAYGSQIDVKPKMNGKLRVTTLSPDQIRYTGKPYIKELGAYLFKFRTYSPYSNRWTTRDPCGFPDGANNSIYSPVPTQQLDATGRSSNTPSGQDMWDAYSPVSEDSMSGPNPVYTYVGGDIAKHHFNDIAQYGDPNTKDWYNSCALRISIAFNFGLQMYAIPQGTDGSFSNETSTPEGQTTEYYIVAASKMKDYLRKIWGDPDDTVASGANYANSDRWKLVQNYCSKTGRLGVAVVCSNGHVGLYTTAGYIDSSEWSWDLDAEVWILE